MLKRITCKIELTADGEEPLRSTLQLHVRFPPTLYRHLVNEAMNEHARCTSENTLLGSADTIKPDKDPPE